MTRPRRPGGRAAGASLSRKLAFLRAPSSYPRQHAPIECIETHFAWVFLTARHAYKLKKPLRLRRVDYRSVASRRRSSEAECRLNRRLAGWTYLGKAPLGLDSSGQVTWIRTRPAIDWLVKMRRLDRRYLLDQILRRRELRGGEIERMARVLRRFYESGARTRPLAAAAYRRRLKSEVADNYRAIARACPPLARQAQAVRREQQYFLQHEAAAQARRASLIVDGHGDLKPEHFWLGNPLQIIDALEFDARLRRLDPADELALLVVEFEMLGRSRSAQRLLDRLAGSATLAAPPAMWHFYLSHRAATRAKLSAWHLGDTQFPDPRPWRNRAQRYLRLALHHARLASTFSNGPNSPATGKMVSL
jgi:aminoglycoside phosphotransferase family enzyme